MTVLLKFPAVYTQKTKHRKKCFVCGKLIQDGEFIIARKINTEKWYPVEGLMWFVKWQFRHGSCKEKA